MAELTFVYNLIEVRATNRVAKKLGALARPNDMMVEITPIHEDDGTWVKFVPISELFAISEVDDVTKSD